ncbi:MAG: LysM peptidoglycan-binding domain-containing protein [Oscillospiraceae bacterium]|nr:LysM peptidoglycan-binding domain-containing protein [Oscillospiraceae bacterium]
MYHTGTGVRLRLVEGKGVARRRLRLVSKGRFALFLICSLLLIIGLASAMATALGGRRQMGYEDGKAVESVIIKSGDSLWSIAIKYCPPNMDIRLYIDEIKAINGLSGNVIYCGGLLRVPT